MRLLVLLTLIFLSACGTTYRNRAEEFARTQPESAWGARPVEGHQKAETEWIKSQLKDPYSADIRHKDLGRYVLPASFTDPTVVPVWGSRVEVNAKNSFGGYTGFKLWTFYYNKGTLFVVEDAQGVKTWVGQSSSYTDLQNSVNRLR